MQQNTSGEKKRQIRPLMIGAIVLLLIGVTVSATLINRTITRNHAEAQFAALSGSQEAEETDSDVVEEEPVSLGDEWDIDLPDDVTVPAKKIDWDALHAENEDIYAWITIPGTNVDYPILQSADELDYYLDHNLDHSKGYPGCIYTRYDNAKDFEDPNTVIYGHNMKDGSMFKTLHYFQDGEFFEKNPYMYVWEPGRLMVYEIFAAYSFGDADLLASVDFDDPDTFANYLDSLMGIRDLNVHLRKDTYVPLNEECRIITLSTCIAGADNLRYLVQGVRIGEIEEKNVSASAD